MGLVMRRDWASIWRRRFDDLDIAIMLSRELRALGQVPRAQPGPAVDAANDNGAQRRKLFTHGRAAQFHASCERITAAFEGLLGDEQARDAAFSSAELEGFLVELARRFGGRDLAVWRDSALKYVAAAVAVLADPDHRSVTVGGISELVESIRGGSTDARLHEDPSMSGSWVPSAMLGSLNFVEFRSSDEKYARVSWNAEGAILLVAARPGDVAWSTHGTVGDALLALVARWTEYQSIRNLVEKQLEAGAIDDQQASLIRAVVPAQIDEPRAE